MYILQCPLHHHQDIEPFRSIVLFYNQQILGSKHFSDLFLNHRLFLPISELRIKGYMQYIVVCTSFILLIIMVKIHPYGSPCQQFSSSVVFSFFFFLFFAQYYSGICIYRKLSILLEIMTNCMAVIRNPLSAQAQRRSSQSSFCHYWSWFLLQHPTAYEKGTRKADLQATPYFIPIWQHLLLGLSSILVQNPISIQEQNCYHTHDK